jgi:hypothetical protein
MYSIGRLEREQTRRVSGEDIEGGARTVEADGRTVK